MIFFKLANEIPQNHMTLQMLSLEIHTVKLMYILQNINGCGWFFGVVSIT